QVSMSLANYSDVHGHLPDQVVRQEPTRPLRKSGPPDGAGRPLYSWRVEIVPYFGKLAWNMGPISTLGPPGQQTTRGIVLFLRVWCHRTESPPPVVPRDQSSRHHGAWNRVW